MDFFTHLLSGLALGLLSRNGNQAAAGGASPAAGAAAASAAGAGQSSAAAAAGAAKAARITVLVASVLPDIDIVARIAGPFAYFRYHRGPTHAILGLIVLSALLAAAVGRFYPAAGKKKLFLWALLGTTVHVGLDLLTSYSTFLLWPFSDRPFFTGILRFSDRTGWYLLGGASALGLLASRLRRFALKPAWFGFAALLLYGSYIGGRAWVRYELRSALAEHYAETAGGGILVSSRTSGISDWNFVVDGPGEYITGTVSYPGAAVTEHLRLPKDHDEEAAGRAMTSEIARFVRDFSPVLHIRTEKRGDGYIVSLGDLRYGPSPRLRAEVLLDAAGNVTGEAYLGFGGRFDRRPR